MNVYCLNGQVKFDGKCEETRPFCGAVCCKNTMVLLTEEEKNSGKYDYVEATNNCNCKSCQTLRGRNAVALRRRSEGCVYLDGTGKCSIYEDRPEVCRKFQCNSTFWSLSISSQQTSRQTDVPTITETLVKDAHE